MKSVSIVLMVLALAYGIDPSLIQTGSSKVEEITTSNLGRFILDLAEVHSAARGPLGSAFPCD